MGSQFITHRFPAVTESELKELYKQFIEDEEREHGTDSYNGTLTTCHGFRIDSFVARTENQACEYLDDKATKWDEAIAIRVGEFPQPFKLTKAGAELFKKLEEARKALETFDVDVIQRVKSAKSKTKGCGNCGSSIAVRFIKTKHEFITTNRGSIHEEQVDHPTVSWTRQLERKETSRGLYGYASVSRVVYSGDTLKNIELKPGETVQTIVHMPAHSSTLCPVCEKNYLLTETDLKRKERLKEKFGAIAVKYEDARDKHDKTQTAKGFWLVGGRAAC